MSDQWTSPPRGLGYAGDAKRERPIFAKEGVGPWRASVTVTPILHAAPETLFEVAVSWTGPPLSIPPHDHDAFAAGPSWDGPATLANDSYYTPGRELAEYVARRAVDALRVPQRPDLRSFAQGRGAAR